MITKNIANHTNINVACGSSIAYSLLLNLEEEVKPNRNCERKTNRKNKIARSNHHSCGHYHRERRCIQCCYVGSCWHCLQETLNQFVALTTHLSAIGNNDHSDGENDQNIGRSLSNAPYDLITT